MSASHNNGMHPTRDTLPVNILRGAGGRVMPALDSCLAAKGNVLC
jgi:hypothetical protein